ncbi:hypothetical protein B0H13DRAFT_1850406 [Mycena leptocephala]|nr:hypothetical protein B0H13DRAFT_1850406 [Mycena leptocephala]
MIPEQVGDCRFRSNERFDAGEIGGPGDKVDRVEARVASRKRCGRHTCLSHDTIKVSDTGRRRPIRPLPPLGLGAARALLGPLIPRRDRRAHLHRHDDLDGADAPGRRADVPLAVYLSGGIDSAAVAGIATHLLRKKDPGARVTAFTMAYSAEPETHLVGSDDDEIRDTSDLGGIMT